jgi:hypothetical protein
MQKRDGKISPAVALSLGFFEIEAMVRNTIFSKPERTTATAW